MRICEANISPIFAIYSSGDSHIPALLDAVSSRDPYISARDASGAGHRLWEISDPDAIGLIRRELEGRQVFIADGHHRYETALEYQRQMREKEDQADGPRPYDYVMMFLADMSDEGLTVLPTHRLVRELPEDVVERLSGCFDIEHMAGGEIAAGIAGQERVLGFYNGGEGWYRLRYREGYLSGVPPVLAGLDVSILHELVFGKLLGVEDITYEMDVSLCMRLVREGQFKGAFFLNPTRVGDVEAVALSSLRMPPKSTYFYPKLLTGLVFNIFKYTS